VLGKGAVCLFALGCASCASLVAPPTAPRDPVSVFVLREARHVGVVFPQEQRGAVARYVEFGYGDWAWYALERDRWFHVFAAVLWPTQGALCRREHDARTPEQLVARAHWVELDELRVERASAAAMLAELEARFDARSAQAVELAEFAMTFTPCESSYWFQHTCADEAAEWLERMGCHVAPVPIRIGLRARPPAAVR